VKEESVCCRRRAMSSAGNPVEPSGEILVSSIRAILSKEGTRSLSVEVEKEGVSRDEPPDVQGFRRWSYLASLQNPREEYPTSNGSVRDSRKISGLPLQRVHADF